MTKQCISNSKRSKSQYLLITVHMQRNLSNILGEISLSILYYIVNSSCLAYYPIFIKRCNQDKKCIGGTIILNLNVYHIGYITIGNLNF